MDKILKIAIAELGQKEISGPQDNPTIVNYAKEAGFDWVNDDETPWCSIFVNWVAKKAGLKDNGKANARSWLLEGMNVDTSPEPGDVVIFWRESPDSWLGHVGFFLGFSIDGERVYCLGGNQGNQVSVSAYSFENVLGFRRLMSSGIIALPDPILQKGDKGNAVKDLQNALKAANIDCGTSDGDFGRMTEDALKLLQSMKTGLVVDGVYNEETKDFLFQTLNA
ncbi:MAG: TIGR02594 family protein [Bacteroidales bacterium]|nr:TIGR02594 family protein [Bacteroidales bacterium]